MFSLHNLSVAELVVATAWFGLMIGAYKFNNCKCWSFKYVLASAVSEVGAGDGRENPFQ